MNKTQTSIHSSLFVLGFSAFLPQGLSALALLIVLMVWLLSKDQRELHRQRMPPKTIVALLLAFAIWPFIVAAYSGWFTDTTTRLLHMARVALMLQMGLMATRSERLITFKGLVFGGVFASCVVLIHQLYPLPEWAIWHHLLAVKGSQSSRAMIMLALTSGICLAMWLHANDRLKIRPFFWLAGAIFFATVVGILSISRNAQLVLIAMPLVLMIHLYRSWKGVLIAITLCSVLAILGWEFSHTISTRFNQAASELQAVISSGNCDSSVGARFAMYEMAWHQLLTHPWMGTGIGSFVDYWSAWAQQRCPSISGIRQPHNDFLLFAMESGWVGLITTLAVIFWFVKTFWQQATTSGSIGLLLCTTFIITGLVNSPMRDSGIGFVMIFLLAACCAQSHKKIIRGH